MSILFGCIADDFTGATDLANTLVKAGMQAVQLLDMPSAETTVPRCDAVIVALKSRSNPASEAVAQSLQALEWLRAQQPRQYFLKYCSTFDSTERGNIGPVAEALMAALGERFTVSTRHFPQTSALSTRVSYSLVTSSCLNQVCGITPSHR